jgi:branched-subunit amino acid ABC-type transport system permease component
MALLGAYLAYFSYNKGDSMATIVLLVLLAAAVPLFFIYMQRMSKFTFRENSLLIQTIGADKIIDYVLITHVEEVGPFTVHATPVVPLSGNMIMIRYGARGMVHISPKRKEQFLAKLISKLPPNAYVKRKSL